MDYDIKSKVARYAGLQPCTPQREATTSLTSVSSPITDELDALEKQIESAKQLTTQLLDRLEPVLRPPGPEPSPTNPPPSPIQLVARLNDYCQRLEAINFRLTNINDRLAL